MGRKVFRHLCKFSLIILMNYIDLFHKRPSFRRHQKTARNYRKMGKYKQI